MKNKRLPFLCILIFISLLQNNAEEEILIGHLYKNKKLPPFKFVGLKKIVETELTTYLLNNKSVVRFNSPSYPAKALKLVLSVETKKIYQTMGFENVKVDIELKPAAINFSINEGQQKIYGDFKVSGNKKLEIQKIKTTLAIISFYRSPKNEFWKKGEGFFIEKKYQEKLYKIFDQTFLEMGYPNVDYELKTEESVNEDYISVNLNLKIINENEIGKIKRITFQGVNQDSQKAILETINLKLNDHYQNTDKINWINLLKQTGRYAEVYIDTKRLLQKDIHLHFTIQSIKGLPPLNKKLSEHQMKILSFLEQLVSLGLYKNGMNFNFKNDIIKFSGYYQSNHGLYLKASATKGDIHLLITQNKIILIDHKNYFYESTTTDINLDIHLTIDAIKNETIKVKKENKSNKNEEFFTLNLGAAYRQKEENDIFRLPINFKLSKAAMLLSILKKKVTASINKQQFLMNIKIDEGKDSWLIKLNYNLVNNPEDKLEISFPFGTLVLQKQSNFFNNWTKATQKIIKKHKKPKGIFLHLKIIF